MQKCNENAANRYSYVGEIFTVGERARKREILDTMPKEWRALHEEGFIHIHDLDAYGLTYNCLTFDILRDFPYERFAGMSTSRKILATFEYLKTLFTDIGNEQSGGMALANFDGDMAKILESLGLTLTEETGALIADAIHQLIDWCNHTHTRMGQTSYYVSLNIGLGRGELARFLARTLIDEFLAAGDLVFKPNIIFKVKAGVNRHPTDPNHDILRAALLCTAQKMIPTYLLCDSEPNRTADAERLAVMGCRTRVVDDVFGQDGSVGRGNIDNISINLPRLALLAAAEHPHASFEERLADFTARWDAIARVTKDILLDRYEKVCARRPEDFPINRAHHLWCEDFTGDVSVLRHGTLSLGFIGLSEAMEVLSGKRYYNDPVAMIAAIGFVRHMREYCDFLRLEHGLNFSLLATSGELISGRFTELDRATLTSEVDIFSKGFYTNSFHVNVDSDLPAFQKIEIEGIFHKLCNGGCITYAELGEAPLGNDEGLREYIECAVESGVHYLGFNFPKDVCGGCGATGVFDACPACGSREVVRVRRVSGYLEVLDGFTKGKKNEERKRRAN